jgi:hypothetical protein
MLDSGASHDHITSDLANFNAEEYGGCPGSYHIRVSNGTGLFIKHIGNGQISAAN